MVSQLNMWVFMKAVSNAENCNGGREDEQNQVILDISFLETD